MMYTWQFWAFKNIIFGKIRELFIMIIQDRAKRIPWLSIIMARIAIPFLHSQMSCPKLINHRSAKMTEWLRTLVNELSNVIHNKYVTSWNLVKILTCYNCLCQHSMHFSAKICTEKSKNRVLWVISSILLVSYQRNTQRLSKHYKKQTSRKRYKNILSFCSEHLEKHHT